MTEIGMNCLSIIETNSGIFYIVTFILWNIIMDDWILDEKTLN